MKKALLFCSCLLFCFAAIARDNNTPTPQSFANKKAPLSFMENKGQITDQNYQPRPDIQFQLKAANGLTIFVGDGAIHYQFAKADRIPEPRKPEDRFDPKKMMEHDSTNYTMYRMDVELIGANKHAQIITEDKQDYYDNYYTTGTGDNGATVYAYSKITYKDIYPNIDWVLYTRNNELKHEFIVKQGGNPADIKLKYCGATNLQLHQDGSLEATTPQGTITEQAPVSYTQEGQQVTSSFSLQENVLSYEVGNYEGTLVIDPSLVWATYYGGSGYEAAYAITSDSLSNAYITGSSEGTNSIATIGAYQIVLNGSSDVFMAKFNYMGMLQWATYYGGSGVDQGHGISIDGAGNVFITGMTLSTNNIATIGAYQTLLNGGNDAFIAKFNSAGTIQWATYYGGNNGELYSFISIDDLGNVLITGFTNSNSGIATIGAYQTVLNGSSDAFIAKFNTNGIIQWASYFGGSGDEWGTSIDNDNSGSIYITGYTSSSNGIVTPNVYQTIYGGGNSDAFIVKFSSLGIRLWATYYGGSSDEYPSSIKSDDIGNILITGYTNSTNNITSSSAYQTSYSGGDYDSFIAKFTNNGIRLWATYFGGNGFDESICIIPIDTNNIYIVGVTNSNSNIATGNAYQSNYGGGITDAFIAKVNNFGIIQWSTYFGGNDNDGVLGLSKFGSNNILITGYTTSSNNIATLGAYQSSYSGNCDAILAKFSDCISPSINVSIDTTVCIGNQVILNAIATATISWSGGITNSQPFVPQTSGYYVATATDSNGCINTDTVHVTVANYPTATISSGATAICPNGNTTLSASGGSSYLWSNGDTTATTTVNQTGNYYVVATNQYGCSDTSQPVTITVHPFPTINAGIDQTICAGTSIQLNATSNASISWNNGVVNNQSFIPTASTNYIATATDSFGCSSKDSVLVTVHALPNVSGGANQAICTGTAVALTGTGANTYSWNMGITNAQNFVPAATNTYTVTGSDTNGCINTAQVMVTVNPLPNVSAGSNQTVCLGTPITLNGSGAVIYTWNNSVVNGQAFSPSQSGVYSVVGTDGNGCSNTAQVTITVNPVPNTNGGPDKNVCAGNATSLTATGANSYSWTGGIINHVSFIPTNSMSYVVTGYGTNGCSKTDTVLVTVNPLPNVSGGISQSTCTGSSVILSGSGANSYTWSNNVVNGQSFIPNQTHSYTVTGTDLNGCVNTAQVTVTVNPLPNVSAGNNQAVCLGNPVILNGSGAVNYSWNNSVINSQSFIPTQTNVYTVTGTDGNGCSNTAQTTVTVHPLPNVNGGMDQFVCAGNATVLSATGANTYSWSGGVVNNQSFTPTSSGNYVVTGTDVNGCNNKDTVLVSINPLPIVSGGVSQTICSGSSITLSGSGANSYSWSNSVVNGQSFIPTQTHTYTVIGTDVNGCSNTAQVLVTINPLPNVLAGNNQAVCFGNPVTLSASGAINYSWNNSVLNGQAFIPTQSTVYSVNGIDGNGCSNTAQVTVTVNPLPSNIFAQDSLVLCDNNSIVVANPIYSVYQWNNGITTYSNNIQNTGLYWCTVQNTFGCTASDSVFVKINPSPTSISNCTQPAICPNGNTTLTASGGLSYLWNNGDTSATTIVNQVGNYYVIVANEYGCTDTSNVILISQKTLPNQLKIKAVGATSVCEPNTVAFVLDMPLGSTTGFGYQWYLSGSAINGATDSTFNANTTGSYALSISGGDNCLKYATAKTATIKAAPVASFTATTATTFCSGGYVGLVAPSISGCTYTWLRDGLIAGSGNSKIFKLAGNYTVIAKLNGCSDTASPAMPIVVNPLPVASVAALNATTFCAGDSCTIVASPTGAVSYEWHNGTFILDTTATEQFKIGITATIKVLVKDANGCIGKLSASSVKTKANAVPLASISSNGSTTISSTGNVKLKATPSSGVTWQWFKDGNVLSNATANTYTATSGGSYTVAITKLGCTGNSTPVVVTQTTPKENAVTTIDGSFEMSAYPNPVSDVLTVTIRGIEGANGTIQVIDVLGKVVKSLSCKEDANQTTTNNQQSTINYQLSTDNWSSGVYLIRYKDETGRTGTLKVVKE